MPDQDRSEVMARLSELAQLIERIHRRPLPWVTSATQEILGDFERTWRALHEATAGAVESTAGLAPWLDENPINPAPSHDLQQVRADAEQLLAHLESGGGWGIGPFRSAAVKRALYIRELCVLKTKGWERDDVTNPETCSSSPAGASPVRVIARKPGSRSAARAGNGPGRARCRKPYRGSDHTVRSMKRSLPRFEYRSRDGNKEEPSPELQGEGHGRGEAPGCAASKNLPA